MKSKTLIVIAFFLCTFCAAFVFRLTYISNPNWVAIYMPNNSTPGGIIALANKVDAKLVRGTKLKNVHILRADHENLRQKLRKQGIWLTLDPIVLKGCGLASY